MREVTSPRGLSKAARSIGGAVTWLGLSLASAAGCSDEFESCEARRTCASEGTSRDAGAGGRFSGAGGRGSGAGTGGVAVPGAGGVPLGGAGGVESSGGGDAGPSAGGAAAGGHDAGTVDGSSDGPADSATPEDGAAEADARVRCPPGQEPCGAVGCVDLTRNADHCGECDSACAATGVAQRACVAGECKPSCDTEHVDCNEDGKDGCEVDLRNDPDHCGACNTVCATTGTSRRVCEGGVCKPVCLATHRDCNSIGRDGCEINVQSNVSHCGACDRSCSSAGAAQRRCVAGACAPTCSTGLGDCSTPGVQTADDGCEASLTLSTQCGACGHDCDGASCTAALLTCSAQTLASGVTYPISLAVTDLHVFWGREGASAGAGSIWRTPVRGGQSLELFQSATITQPVAVVTDGTTFFWADPASRGIYAATDFAFSSYRQLVGGPGAWQSIEPTSLVRSGAYLYWADYNRGEGLRVVFDGSAPPTTLFSVAEIGEGPADVRVDPPYLYYWYFDQVLRISLDGSGGEEHVAFSASYAITGTHIYSSRGSLLSRTPKTSLGAWQDLSALPSGARHIVVAEPYAYVAATGGIYRMPTSGGLADRVSTLGIDVRQMVIHAGVLYWVDRGNLAGTGGLYRMVLDE